jgi:CRISPR-associated protein Csc3
MTIETENSIVSEILKQMAEIGWNAKLKGKSLARSSLMMPIQTIFHKLRRQQQILDVETLRASTITEIFTYLENITTDPKYKPGRNKHLQIESFVNLFFQQIFEAIYQNKLPRLLKDEKDIKGAYLFYVRNQIPEKQEQEES